jgi:SAM-dependent methyltransferase
MAIPPLCSTPECSLANTNVWLRGTAPYRRDGETQVLHYEFRRCARCEMAFVHPTPPAEVMACFYSPEYTYYAPVPEATTEREARSWKYSVAPLRYAFLLAPGPLTLVQSLAGRMAEVISGKIVSFTLGVPLLLDKETPILDFGCGSGTWLRSLARLGYRNLLGYDLDANQACRREPDLRGVRILSPATLRQVPPGSLGCVRLEHVFEHLTDPPGALRLISELLRPGGMLVMTFPSVYPWAAIEDLGSSPALPHVQLPIHLAHHSTASATRLLRDAGFEVAGLRITPRERLITTLARRPGSAAP